MSARLGLGPAFPVPNDRGMTLRDYFAAKAMNGLLCLYTREESEGDPDSDVLAEHAYEIADAMLKARRA